MNNKICKELNDDFEKAYKAAVRPLYIKWRQINQNQVGEMFCYWVFRHHHEKTMELLNRRNKRKMEYKKLKTEIEMNRVEQEIKNFEESL